MKRHITILASTLFLSVALFGQITVNQSDMPTAGDTVRVSTAVSISGLDPSISGQGITWDYSSLSPQTQTLDSFISVSSVPLVFQIFFNNPTDPNRATVAQISSAFDFIPGLSLADVLTFYRSDATKYQLVGYAGEFNGIPLPAKFTNPDIWYRFPMQYGNSDSTIAILNLSLPGLGSLYIERNRRNFVEGYGTLITPYGTNQVLKVRSEVDEYDSLYLDTLGQGLGLQRVYTEYKWIGKGFDLPLLQVVQEGALQTITYIDSLRNTTPGIRELSMKEIGLKVWPNPSSADVQLGFTLKESGFASVQIYDMTGKEIFFSNLGYLGPGENQISLKQHQLPAKPGTWLLRLNVPGATATTIFMRQ